MPIHPHQEPDVPSPCVGICRLDDSGRFCLGCLRSLGEIAEWGTASNTRRLAILARIARDAAPDRSDR